jgi:hypothetical protein
MGAAMEEARRLLYEKAIKKFTLQEVTKHKTIKHKNLVEMLSRYPGYGVGFKVHRKWWPENMFFHVKRVELQAPRFGKMWGVMYKDGAITGTKIEPIDGILKRGVWNYHNQDEAFTEPSITLDNGLTMDLARTQKLIDEKKEFLTKRSKSI